MREGEHQKSRILLQTLKHLHHVEWRRQHQKIDAQAKQSNNKKGTFVGCQRIFEQQIFLHI